jgi:hypothetical protein
MDVNREWGKMTGQAEFATARRRTAISRLPCFPPYFSRLSGA